MRLLLVALLAVLASCEGRGQREDLIDLVTYPPGAMVTKDGQYLGLSPLVIPSPEPESVFGITLDGYLSYEGTWTRLFFDSNLSKWVPKGERAHRSLVLQLYGSSFLKVETPNEAPVNLQFTAVIGGTLDSSNLPPNTFHFTSGLGEVTASIPGYAPIHDVLFLPPDKTYHWRPAWQPLDDEYFAKLVEDRNWAGISELFELELVQPETPYHGRPLMVSILLETDDIGVFREEGFQALRQFREFDSLYGDVPLDQRYWMIAEASEEVLLEWLWIGGFRNGSLHADGPLSATSYPFERRQFTDLASQYDPKLLPNTTYLEPIVGKPYTSWNLLAILIQRDLLKVVETLAERPDQMDPWLAHEADQPGPGLEVLEMSPEMRALLRRVGLIP